MDSIRAYLDSLKQGGKQNHLNLTIIPLLKSDNGEPDYLILEEALSQEVLVIYGSQRGRKRAGIEADQ